MASALIVEDDPDVYSLLDLIVSKYYDEVEVVTDGDTAIRRLRTATYDLVVLDLMLPNTNGFAVAETIQGLPQQPEVVVLSAVARYFSDRFPKRTVLLQKPFEIFRLETLLSGMAPA